MFDAVQAASKLSLHAYQERALASNQFKDNPEAFNQLRFGFFGEVGGILAAVKKTNRDLGPAEQASVTEELGDALWYLTTVALECKHTLEEVGTAALHDLQQRLKISNGHAGGNLTFETFDGLVGYCRAQVDALPRTEALRELGAHCGALMSASISGDLVSHSKLDLLGSLFADMVLVCAQFDLKFTSVAEGNMAKFESRWPPKGTPYLRAFDEEYPKLERFPRKFTMRFIEIPSQDDAPYVIQQLNGVNIGDRLTDNRTEADGYRFHDVFHLAYIAHLGWSPVIRGLLKLKRKSKPQIDRDEDGARAMIIEEGIATWIFNHASRHRYFAGTATGKLDLSILKQVREMVKGYEVYDCPLWQWENAILEGFKVFRQIYEAGEGDVNVDMDTHSITFSPTTEVKTVEPAARPKRSMVVGTALPPVDKKKA